jgi:predicted transposase YbfD/YdcC
MHALPHLLDHFQTLPDPRQLAKVLYPLNEILLLALCATLCGCDTFHDMTVYGEEKLTLLQRLLPFAHGIPCADTLRAVFASLKPSAFAYCFSRWTATLAAHIPEIVAIDGKTLRHSFDHDQPAIHMVSAWASTQQLVLAQVKTDAKSNEITAIPELLALLDLDGAIVTTDAMGTQHAIAHQITEQGGDYMLALKGNQRGLHEDIQAFVEAQEREHFRHSAIDYYEVVEKGHGRIEQRVYGSCDDVAWLYDRFPAWSGIHSVAWVDSCRTVKGVTSQERRYFVSSLPMDAVQAGRAIRGHWGVENGLHYVLDVAFGDDQSRVRRGYAGENLHRVKQMALNLVNRQRGKKSVATFRKRLGWNDSSLLDILHYAT